MPDKHRSTRRTSAPLGEFNLFGSFESVGVVAALLLVFTLLLADFFDTMGTMTAIGAEAGLLDEEGVPPNTAAHPGRRLARRRRRWCRAVSRRTPPTSSRPRASARAPAPGLASVVTGVLFLLAICRSRRWSTVIPSEAAVPALVLVGFLMMQQVKGIDWDDLEIAIPAFLTIVLMPFTYSITVGIGAGFLAYVLHQGRARQGRARSTR